MPRYYEDVSDEECDDREDGGGASGSVRSGSGRSEPRIERVGVVLFLLFFYYFCSCGTERLFQSMVSESREDSVFVFPGSAQMKTRGQWPY